MFRRLELEWCEKKYCYLAGGWSWSGVREKYCNSGDQPNTVIESLVCLCNARGHVCNLLCYKKILSCEENYISILVFGNSLTEKKKIPFAA